MNQRRVTKHVMFSAAHHIPGAGKCERNHGHNWDASITIDQISGELDKQGFIIDVRELKNTAYKYDHDDLNNYFEFPSTENIAYKIAEDSLELCKANNPEGVFMVNVCLQETPDNSANASASNFKQVLPDPGPGPGVNIKALEKAAMDAEAAYQGGSNPKAKFIKRAPNVH